ncbi:ATP-binding cassette domain-containing protein [Rhizobium yanglingense]
MITHDRYFLDNVTGWILELDRGRGIPYEGNYSGLPAGESQAHAAGGPRRSLPPEGHQSREQRVDRLQPQGTPGESPRPVSSAYDELVAAAADRRPGDAADRHPGRRASRPASSSRPRTSPRPMATRVLIENLTFKLPPGGIVGVIGPNGAGKTTLVQA